MDFTLRPNDDFLLNSEIWLCNGRCFPVTCNLLYMMSRTLLWHTRRSSYERHTSTNTTKSGLCFWNRNDLNRVYDGNGGQPKYSYVVLIERWVGSWSKSITPDHIQLSLDEQTVRVMWLEGYDWKSVAMEILLKLNLSFSTLVWCWIKEKTRWLQRSKNSEVRAEFKWEMREMGSTGFYSAQNLTVSSFTWYE